MPCDSQVPKGMTQEQRMLEIQEAIARLEAGLGSLGSVVIGPQGAVTFANWNDRRGVSDACAYRALQMKGSFALQQAMGRAEAMSGRKVNAAAMSAGVHSHDGGQTWHPGH